MKRTEPIAEIGLDDDHRVFVRPAEGDFEHIYRAAMEIYWNRVTGRLSHPAPRNLTSLQWYQQIIAAMADEYGVELQISDKTVWSNVPLDLRAQIEAYRIPNSS